MRFLQIITSANMSGPPDPAHMARVNKSIGEAIASGALLATGAIGKRATSAARVIQKDGKITVEYPPTGDGWMAGGGYSLGEYASKEAAIENAKRTLDIMGDGVFELIQVSEMHPLPGSASAPADSVAMPRGVVPYLSFDDASEAIAFYKRAFDAAEIARMHGPDGKKIMHGHLVINGGALMLADNFPEMGMGSVQRSASYTMQLIVAEGDLWWDRAVKAGCVPRMPFEVAPWGDKYGQMTDPFGVTWAINSPAKT
jgi:PhnB protein